MRVWKYCVSFTEEVVINLEAAKGNLEALKTALNSSQDKNPVVVENGVEGNLTVLHLAAANGHKNILNWYKDVLGFDDLNPTNDKGITPLQLAVKQQKLGIVIAVW